MLVLAIDTATPAITAGIVELTATGRRTVAERVSVDPRAHAELLTPQTGAVLDEGGVRLAELDAIVVGVGPGPFTGLRVGMVTAAAFGHAAGLPVHPVSTLDAIAADALARSPEPRSLLVATDARRKEIYWATYTADGVRRGDPAVHRPEEVAEWCAGISTAAGAGARMYAEALGLPVLELDHPSPRGLVAPAAAALLGGAEPAALVPLYLRRPDAEQPGPPKRVLR